MHNLSNAEKNENLGLTLLETMKKKYQLLNQKRLRHDRQTQDVLHLFLSLKTHVCSWVLHASVTISTLQSKGGNFIGLGNLNRIGF